MSFQPRIFTFYSYKGGVGRSMALLNMAYYLQARGRHVLIVDLDLEAPGASGFLHRSKELLPRESTGDVVDVLAAVVDTVKQASSAGSEPQLPALQLKDYLRSVDPKKHATALHPKAPPARLDVLGAEEGRDYTARFSELGLPALSAQEIGDASDLLRGLLIQHSFPFSQPWQEEGAAPEPTHYDYILVDSRTGLSEIGGLCIGPLSDRLIVLCGLNDQNIEGTRQFMNVVGLKAEVRPANAEAFDDADLPAEDGQRPATLGPKPTLLVASPVPGGEMIYKTQRMKKLEERLGMPPVKLSYHPHMALMETLFVRDHADEYLALEYATLAERLMSMVGDTAKQLMAPVDRFLADHFNEDDEPPPSIVAGAARPMVETVLRLPPPRTSKKEEEKLNAEDLLQRLARSALSGGQNDLGLPPFMISHLDLSDQDLAKIWQLRINLAPTDELAAQRWLEWADDLDTEDERITGSPAEFQVMEDKYRRAVTLRPQFHEAFCNWGMALAQWATTKTGAEAESLYAQADEKFQRAVVIEPNDLNTLHNWGRVLWTWAKTKTGTEVDAMFIRACEKFQQAAAVDASDHATILNWGSALLEWALTKDGDELDALAAKACVKFQQAATIDPDDHNTLHNWGIALMQRANTKTGVETDELLVEACEKFQQTASIGPDDPATLNVWGSALIKRATSKTGRESDALFDQAMEKFEQAASIEPDDTAMLRGWALALLQQAETKDGVEAEAMLAQACEKFQQMAALEPCDNTKLFIWGNALMQQAKTKTGSEADAFYAQACEKFMQAAAIKPDDCLTFRMWAFALLQWANSKAGVEANALYAQVCEKCQLAAAIQRDDLTMLTAWTFALLKRAKAAEGIEAANLSTQACEKLQQAAAIEPNDSTTFRNWAFALWLNANTKKGIEAEALVAQAFEKFNQAAAIDPNDCETLNNWCNTLLQWAKTKEAKEADDLIDQAYEKCEKTLLIQPGNRSALYNLGCIAALRGKVEEAVATLEKWKSSDPEANKVKLDEDSDFDLIRNDPRFLALRVGLAD